MADTGNKLVTISQAARYLGKDVSGGIGDSVITLRQLRAMRDGSKATPTVLPSGYTELEYIESHADGPSDGQFYANDGTGSFTAGPVVPHSADPRDGLVVRVSQLARIEIGPTIVSWSTGTDEEIAAMVAAADAGKINLSDYWHEGDTRTVRLSVMPATGVGESHAAQSVQFVLTDPGHYTLANGKKCNFVVLQKDCLKETGVMNAQDTNSGGWDACPRRTWCNSVYRNAIPSTLRGIFKQFKVRTANGSGSGVTESTDWFSLFSEKEVFGSTSYANSSAESQNSQLTWFKTSSNRIKRVNGSAYLWWERSPRSGNSYYFCFVRSDGSASAFGASGSRGLAPFGCI